MGDDRVLYRIYSFTSDSESLFLFLFLPAPVLYGMLPTLYPGYATVFIETVSSVNKPLMHTWF
jgi:hypothetical protein